LRRRWSSFGGKESDSAHLKHRRLPASGIDVNQIGAVRLLLRPLDRLTWIKHLERRAVIVP